MGAGGLPHGLHYGNIQSGEVDGDGTAKALPSIEGQLFLISALNSNVGDVYLGGSGVTIPDGTTDTTSGLELQPGDTITVPIHNLSLLYIIADNDGDDIT